ncbi:MAG TPA: hypothetical protein VD788_02965, partial [Candidatus Polarisedimenticolaceae bacterium]|nr:hypothetical protein [Candidatus Polarisedimenticolaceae bacterium]
TTNRNMRRLAMTLGQLVDLAPPRVLIYFADVTRSNPGEHYLSFFGSNLVHSQPALEAISADAVAGGLAFDQVVNQASAQGVRIYTVEARGLVADADRARTGSATAAATGQNPPSSSRVRIGDTHRTLQGMAAETGGYAFLHGVRASKIAERIREDSQCVYLASFDPGRFARDQPLRLVVELVGRPEVELRVRGRIVIESASARKTAELLRAFAAPNSIPDPFEVNAGLVPTGFDHGRYTALLQVAVPGSPLPTATWDLGASLVMNDKVREKAAGRLSANGPNVPVILESQVSFKPGAYELVAVAHEEHSGLVSSTELFVDWPSLDEPETMVGPIALLQPATGAFMRQGETRGEGSLLVAVDRPLSTTLPSAFVGIVCRRKADRRLEIRRAVIGSATHEFPVLELGGEAEHCAQLRDVVPSNTLPRGYYSYTIEVLADGATLDRRQRDFVVIVGEPAGPD